MYLYNLNNSIIPNLKKCRYRFLIVKNLTIAFVGELSYTITRLSNLFLIGVLHNSYFLTPEKICREYFGLIAIKIAIVSLSS